MDLGAYRQVEELKPYLEIYKIEIPRLRGLRLMKREEKVSKEEMEKNCKDNICYELKWFLEEPINYCNSCSRGWKKPKAKGLIYGTDGFGIDYDLSQIHGWKKKKAKYIIKKNKQAFYKQYNLFNSMVGKDVLYVHARIGGNNWNYFNGDTLTKHPRYLAHTDDVFDKTYCDIYFNIGGAKND